MTGGDYLESKAIIGLRWKGERDVPRMVVEVVAVVEDICEK